MNASSIVLVVDDLEAGRATLAGLLQPEGYRLEFASSGGEALAKAAECVPDVILLDIMMPGMDGYEACRRLRADPGLGQIPVIMVTALDDRASRLTGLDAGADDFIIKPFDRSELRARVRTVLRLDRFRRLLAERAQVQWVVDQADDGYLIRDQDDQITYANQRARWLLGAAEGDGAEDLGGFLAAARRWYSFVPEQNWREWPPAPGGLPGVTRYLLRPESAELTALWLQVDVSDAGRLPGRQLVRLRDVSEQVTQHCLRRTFQAQVQHKLRTPLTHLQGSLELLGELLPGDLPPDCAELYASARLGAGKLAAAIADVLLYIDGSGSAAPHEGFDLARVEEVVRQVARELGLETLSFELDLELPPPLVQMSPGRFELALRELLENSVKFHPRHQPLVDVRITQAAPGRVMVAVTDDGAHMAPDQLAVAWQPYHQSERTFTGQTPGMGLGLATVAAVVWSAGGECRLRNRPDRPGVIAELVLPASPRDLRPADPPQWT